MFYEEFESSIQSLYMLYIIIIACKKLQGPAAPITSLSNPSSREWILTDEADNTKIEGHSSKNQTQGQKVCQHTGASVMAAATSEEGREITELKERQK